MYSKPQEMVCDVINSIKQYRFYVHIAKGQTHTLNIIESK